MFIHVDLDLIKANLHNEGVQVHKRMSVYIPKEVKTFPDHGKGHCKLCGGTLLHGRRKYCSDKHGDQYRQETYPYIVIHWNSFRNAILIRDGFNCKECEITERQMRERNLIGGLDVHHIIPLNKGGEEFNPDNCTTLCSICHKAKHRKRHLEPKPGSFQTKIGTTGDGNE